MSYIGNSPTQSAFVTDLFNGNGSTTAFTMSVSPANPSSILVAVSGVLQSPDTYSVSGQTLNFSAAPPSATGNISVRYLGIPASGVTTTAYRTLSEYTATASQTTFTPPSYTVGFINVFRNGVMLGTADYTANNGTSVVLNNACTSGDLVVIESFYVSSVLNAIPATANAVNTLYIADNSITASKIVAGSVTAGSGPSFSAKQEIAQTITAGGSTKANFSTEIWDTANCYDTTNSRFTPNVAGYYQVNTKVYILPDGTSYSTDFKIALYKNGSLEKYIVETVYSRDTSTGPGGSTLVYLNGTTDYIEIYVSHAGATSRSINSFNRNYFEAFLARIA